MENERFNMPLRKFLKHVGVTSQQEIERFVARLGGEGHQAQGQDGAYR